MLTKVQDVLNTIDRGLVIAVKNRDAVAEKAPTDAQANDNYQRFCGEITALTTLRTVLTHPTFPAKDGVAIVDDLLDVMCNRKWVSVWEDHDRRRMLRNHFDNETL